jgi:hypothetical protein
MVKKYANAKKSRKKFDHEVSFFSAIPSDGADNRTRLQDFCMVCKDGGDVYQCTSCPRTCHGECSGHTPYELNAMMYVYSSPSMRSMLILVPQVVLLHPAQLQHLLPIDSGSRRTLVQVSEVPPGILRGLSTKRRYRGGRRRPPRVPRLGNGQAFSSLLHVRPLPFAPFDVD